MVARSSVARARRPYIAGLEQERTSCILEETEKIEKQTLHNANKSTV